MSPIAPSERSRPSRRAELEQLAEERILVLDGAIGTMIQERRLEERDYRGDRFREHPIELRGDMDLLNLTRPDVVRDVHLAYLEAGADVVETNTFNATSISQEDYGLAHLAYELNLAGAAIARGVADAAEASSPGRPRFVAGVLGPTSRTASISPDVSDPAARNVRFDDLRAAYRTAAEGLVDGGSDILMIETVFDTLNARAALFAVQELLEERELDLPLMVSGTITDRSGRTLSGQTPEAFWISVSHARPFSIGLNCALGFRELRGHVAELARTAGARVSTHPNAGLPNPLGDYEETAEETATMLGAAARDGLVNVVGGCCGTTPAHIAAIAAAVEGLPPRRLPERPRRLRLSGLEPFELAR